MKHIKRVFLGLAVFLTLNMIPFFVGNPVLQVTLGYFSIVFTIYSFGYFLAGN